MTLQTFFEKFDLFADTPDAVAKMREIVLDLAVQGKLVERRTSEGDGHVLLEKLRTLSPENNSKSRSPKDIAVEPATSIENPSHWALTTLENTTRDTGLFCDGDWVESKDQDPDGEVRLIQLADVGDGKYRDRSSRFMTKVAASRLNCTYLAAGDILIARMPDPLGRCCRFPGDKKSAVTVVDVCILRSNSTFFDPDFLVVAINSPRFRRLVSAQATGTTRSRISRSNLGGLPVPLPPLAEQKRIVAKVDELMALCDGLEEQLRERETQHAALARASLARFADAPTPANLGLLFHKSYSISPPDLRKSILTLAVQGKLVPQDPNDEPAEHLIARIGIFRREANAKEYAPVSEEEIPYHTPSTWSWIRLGSISLTSDSGWSPQCLPESREGNEWGVLKVSAVSWGVFKPEENKALPPGMEARPDCEVRPGDFLMSRANTEELVARSVVVDKTPPRLMMSDKIVRFTFPDEVDRAFINLANTSETSRAYYARNASGTSSSMKNIGREVICNLPISLPPLAEQRRIVAKVGELMTLVDALETQLATAHITAEKLMDAVVAELTTQD